MRVGYFAIKDKALRDRALKIVLYTTSNVSSIAQYGAVGALEGSQQCIEDFKKELLFRRDMFYKGLRGIGARRVLGHAAGRRVLRVREDQPRVRRRAPASPATSLSWAMAEYLIKNARIGCVPGVDFGAGSEGYIRFCTCRSREELTGALASMKETLSRVRRAISTPLRQCSGPCSA